MFQELVTVNVDETTRKGNMIVLGEVINRIICTPDWHSELNQIQGKKS